MALEVRFTLKGQTQESTFFPFRDKSGAFHLNDGKGLDIPLCQDDNDVFIIEDRCQYQFEEDKDTINERLLGLSEAWMDASAQGFEVSGTTDSSTFSYAYGSNEIFVENKPFSIKQIYDLIKEGDIEISPNFQRNFIWDKTRQSRLIESIFMDLPLPSIYLSQYDDGRLTIVDGLQRLNTIKNFMNDELILNNMEYLEACNGKKYSQLSGVLSPLQMRKFRQTQIMCFVIDYRSPNNLKYDLFKRLNTGGKPLNNQEIRNCLSRPILQKTLSMMTSSDAFMKATQGSIKNSRMEANEAALRFIYFYDQYRDDNPTGNYNNAMETSLNECVDILNKRDDLTKYVCLYANCMEVAYKLFGRYAFRKVSNGYESERTRPINKLLMLAITVLIARHNDKYTIERAKGNNLTPSLAILLDNDNSLYEAISTSTNAKSNISKVMTILKEDLFDKNFE